MTILLVLYFGFIFTLLGFNIDKILIKIGGDPADNFNSALFWYLMADLFLRCMLQPLPTIEILPYLRLKIRRITIIKYLLLRSMVNLFNVLPLFIILPFAIKILLPQFGTPIVLIYLSCILLLIILNNFLAVLIGFLSQKQWWYMFLPMVLLGIALLLNKTGFSVSGSSIGLGRYILEANPVVIAAMIMANGLIIYITGQLLFRNFYIDGIKVKNASGGFSAFFSLNHFKSMGEIGRYLSLEISLLMRNKRPRQMFTMLPLVIVYFAFMGSSGKEFQNPIFGMLIVTLLTGMGSIIYGQFLFSWESTYFDSIMARKNNFLNYVKAKYYLLSGLATVIVIPLLILFSFTKRVDIFLLIAAFFFMTGVNSFIILFFGTFNNGRLDLSSSSFFNYQGIRGNQYLSSLIFMLLPLGIYGLFNYLFNSTVGKLAILLPGILLTFSHNWWIKRMIVPQFYRRKYRNLEGFRKLSF